jgi:hypothetical protein
MTQKLKLMDEKKEKNGKYEKETKTEKQRNEQTIQIGTTTTKKQQQMKEG